MRRREIALSVAALTVCALTSALGAWQLRRADEKLARQEILEARSRAAPLEIGRALVDPQEVEWAPLRATGESVEDATRFLDNKVHQQRPGFRVLTPLRLGEGGRYLLVDRGWIVWGRSRTEVPPFRTDAGSISIDGIAQRFPESLIELRPSAPEGRIWQNFDLERYRRETGLELQPFLLVQTSDTGDGLVRQAPSPGATAERNRAYALQWFSFAAIAAGLYVYWFIRRRRHDGR